jgi:predicted phosphodiesterase
MKIGIVSDTHSNLYALQSVLEHMNSVGVDMKVHLGNIVGNGPKPNETLTLTLEEFHYIVMGDHDLAVVDEDASFGLTPQSRFAVDWTREKLGKEVSYLKNLVDSHRLDEIVFSRETPQGFLGDFEMLFVGNMFAPSISFVNSYNKAEFIKSPLHMSYYSTHLDGKRAIINVGSVGSPRDGDPRASYAVYDVEKDIVTFYRIPYAVDRTVGQMQRAGFSDGAWQRLMYGK